jgi:hypothetical protein
MTCEKSEQIPLDLQLLVYWRQRRLGLRQGCLLCSHIGLRSAAKLEFVLNDNELIALIADQLVCRRDLTTQRSLLNRGGDDIRRESQVCRFKLKLLVFRLSLSGFDLPADSAEHVQRVRHIYADIQEVVGRGDPRR